MVLRIYRKLCFPCIFALCLSCTGQSSFKERALSGVVAFHDADAYMFVMATDSSVIVYNPFDTLFFSKYSPSGTEKFLQRGRGAFEAINPLHSFYTDGKELTVVDHSGISNPIKMLSFDLRSPNDFSNWKCDDLSWLGSMRPIRGIIKLSTDVYLVASGRYGSGTILSRLNVADRVLTPIDFDVKLHSKADDLVREQVLAPSSIICFSKDSSQFAYACGEGQYLEIFELDGRSATNRIRALNIPPRFKETADHSYSMKDREHRGIKLRTGGARLYVFYEQNVELSQYKGYPRYFNDYLDVFNGHGKRLERLQLDMPFSDYILTADGNYLYTSTIDVATKEPLIMKYKLF